MAKEGELSISEVRPAPPVALLGARDHRRDGRVHRAREPPGGEGTAENVVVVDPGRNPFVAGRASSPAHDGRGLDSDEPGRCELRTW